jgi:hypothetical protein
MYNLYDKYLRGNSIGCCPLYVSYYLLYNTLKLKLMYLRGNSIGTDDNDDDNDDDDDDDDDGRRRTTTKTHFKSFQSIDILSLIRSVILH